MTAALWYVVVYSLVVGSLVPAWWAFALWTGAIPEVGEGRSDIWFHIAAEIVTGVILVSGGIGILVAPDAGWSSMLSAFGLGLVVYTLIQSPGYYVDRGERPMIVMFSTIWLFTVPAIVLRFL
jgi:hypothetical protein